MPAGGERREEEPLTRPPVRKRPKPADAMAAFIKREGEGWGMRSRILEEIE